MLSGLWSNHTLPSGKLLVQLLNSRHCPNPGNSHMDRSSPLPLVTESGCSATPGSVPVFNCSVILRTDSATGRISGRVASLPSITADGATERDVLLQITRRFKAFIQQQLAAGTSIPWTDPPQRAAAGESERFVPVHL